MVRRTLVARRTLVVHRVPVYRRARTSTSVAGLKSCPDERRIAGGAFDHAVLLFPNPGAWSLEPGAFPKMLIVDSLIISGVKFVLTRLAEAVEAEMYDETALREELLAAQMKLELGEITEEDFARVEEQVLAGMREVRARQKAASGQARESDGAHAGEGPRFTIESVEANLDRNEDVQD